MSMSIGALALIAVVVALLCFGAMGAVGVIVYFVTRNKKNDES